MTTEPETFPQTLEDAHAVQEQIVALTRQQNLYELEVLTEADQTLTELAASVSDALNPIVARLLTSADIARLNGAIWTMDQTAQQASARKAQLSMILNPPVPPTVPPVAP